MSQSNSILSPEQVEQFYKDGFLLLPNFLSSEEINALLTRSHQLLEEFSLEGHPMTKFVAGDDETSKHVGDDYFLNSGDKIRYFLEIDAVGSDGKLNRPKERAVNKIGHGLHELDPAFRDVTLNNDKLRSVAKDLGFHKDPLVLQSMVICKQPSIGGAVPEHNDSTFLYTSPTSALGFWFALEDCTPDNGALSFLPGSHLRPHPITQRFVREQEGGTGFETIPPVEGVVPGKPEGEYVQPQCPAGTLVLIHGSVLHKSEKNTSLKTRFAYTFHMIESAPHAVYDEKNWLQPTPEMPFSKLFGTPARSSITVS